MCLVIRPAFRRQRLATQPLEGAIAFARDRGAPVLEAYPTESGADPVSSAVAYVGTTRPFESVGFERVVLTSSKSGGRPRRLMRRSLAA